MTIKTPDFELDPSTNTLILVRDGKVIPLSSIETRLLLLFATAPNRLLTRDSLLIKVWRYEYESEADQLIPYIQRLRNKIEDDPSAPKLLLGVPGIGYRYQPSRRGGEDTRT